MHIKEMAARFRVQTADKLRQATHGGVATPVAMRVVLESAVAKPHDFIEGVKRIKETPWYRVLKRRGLRFVPVDYQEGAILVVVGTAASLGVAYLTYKRMKARHQRKKQP